MTVGSQSAHPPEIHSRPDASKSGLWSWAAVLGLASWAIFNWLITFHRTAEMYVAVPTFDYWRIPEYLPKMQALDFRYLWVQHNEHRIVFPDIVYALDSLLFHGRRILPIVFSCFCYLGSWLILARIFATEAVVPAAARAGGVALAGVLLGWKGSTLVLADPFLLQWTLLEFALLGALALVPSVPEARVPWPFRSLVAAGVVATYTSGNGLLIWFVLLAAGWVYGWSKRQLSWLALSGLLADGLYFAGYHFTNGLNFRDFFFHPWYTICFIGSYLSMPFGGMKSPQFGVYVGLGNLISMFLLFGFAAWRKRLRTPAAAVLFGSFGFVMLTVLLTAAGRMNVQDPFYTNAKAVRYLVPALLNWAALILALFWTASLSRLRAYLIPVLTLLIVALLSVSFLKLRWWLNENTVPFVDAQIAEISLQNGIFDPRLLHALFPNPAIVADYLPRLAASRSSLFYKSPGQWIGEPLARLGPSSRTVDRGQVTAIYPVVSGLEVTGRNVGHDPARYSQPLFVNAEGKIVGFGRQLPLGLPAQFLPSHRRSEDGWIGFIPDSIGARSFDVYLRDPRDGALAKLSGNQAVPRLTLVKEEGAIISGAGWESSSITTSNDNGPIPIPGLAPKGQIVGTWRGSVSVTGEFRSTNLRPPPNSCLVLPVLHGADSQLLSVEVVDGSSGQLIAQIPMQNNDLEWQFWRIPLGGAKNVQIVAQDRGPGLREWLAIATPSLCP